MFKNFNEGQGLFPREVNGNIGKILLQFFCIALLQHRVCSYSVPFVFSKRRCSDYILNLHWLYRWILKLKMEAFLASNCFSCERCGSWVSCLRTTHWLNSIQFIYSLNPQVYQMWTTYTCKLWQYRQFVIIYVNNDIQINTITCQSGFFQKFSKVT